MAKRSRARTPPSSSAATAPPARQSVTKAASAKPPQASLQPASLQPASLQPASPAPARLQAILNLLDTLYPEPITALAHRSPLELLVATILSAQCTDERVNQVNPKLFCNFPDAAALAAAPLPQLEEIIHSTGFFRAKARAIKGACTLIASAHQGDVPRSMEALIELPGVARKTANVVLGSAYGIPSGVVVDTHVKRVSGRLELTQHTDPVKIERDLMALIPQERWIDLGHQLILHGRALCQARRPRCEACPLAPHCPAAFQASAAP